MYILFQVKYDINLHVTEGPIYIGDTVRLNCTLRTNNSRAIIAFALGCDPCWSNEAAQVFSSPRLGDIKWNYLGNGESYTHLVYEWKAKETFSPLIICRVWWNGSQRVDSKEDNHRLNITGTY